MTALNTVWAAFAAECGATTPAGDVLHASPAAPAVTVTHSKESAAPSGFTYPASTVVESDALSAYVYDDGLIEVGGTRVDRAEFRAWLDSCRRVLDEQDLIVGAVDGAR